MFCRQGLAAGLAFCTACGRPASPEGGAGAAPAAPWLRPGFSAKICDPAVLAALRKNRRAAWRFAVLLVLAPLAVTLALGVKDGDLTYLGYGAVISAVFLVFSLGSAPKKKGEGQWDGVVIEKHTEVRQDNKLSDQTLSSHTVYIVTIRRENGRLKTLEEREYNRPYFDYLQPGDWVRHHPQFNCFYEKYDKSRDTYALCPICGKRNNISLDTCARCGIPVIK